MMQRDIAEISASELISARRPSSDLAIGDTTAECRQQHQIAWYYNEAYSNTVDDTLPFFVLFLIWMIKVYLN